MHFDYFPSFPPGAVTFLEDSTSAASGLETSCTASEKLWLCRYTQTLHTSHWVLTPSTRALLPLLPAVHPQLNSTGSNRNVHCLRLRFSLVQQANWGLQCTSINFPSFPSWCSDFSTRLFSSRSRVANWLLGFSGTQGRKVLNNSWAMMWGLHFYPKKNTTM